MIAVKKIHYGILLVGDINHNVANPADFPEYVPGAGWHSEYDGGSGYINGRSVAAFVAETTTDEKSAVVYAAARLQDGVGKETLWVSKGIVLLGDWGLAVDEEEIFKSIYLRGGGPQYIGYNSPVAWEPWVTWEDLPSHAQRPLQWALDTMRELFGQGGLMFREE